MSGTARRPRLTPAMADARRAVREALAAACAPGELVLVALSGGADSLALAAATAFEAPRAGIRAGAVVVDHGLQAGSAEVAERAAAQARELGLEPVLVVRAQVVADGDGPEAAARRARHRALVEAADAAGAARILYGHTLDDQAETVLLGLARGSGPDSLHGMAAVDGRRLRPLLGLRRAATRAACLDQSLTPWDDPQNLDAAYARVRVRERVLPLLEAELGPGIAEALARTAAQLREDAAALDGFVPELIEDLVALEEAGVSISAAALEANPAALRHRLIRAVVAAEFHVSLSRAQTLAVAALVTDWHGQGGVDLPGVRVERRAGRLRFWSTEAGELTGQTPPHEH